MTRIAFAGASGTGKSTLAQYIARRYGLEMNPIGSRSVAASMGFASPYDVDAAGKRGEFQRRLLAEKRAWEAARDSFVTDRTTMDNLAYASLHAIDDVDDEYYAQAVGGTERYTQVFLCPVDVFQNLGTDVARRKGKAYHDVYSALLEELVGRYASNVTVLWDKDMDRRRAKIDACF